MYSRVNLVEHGFKIKVICFNYRDSAIDKINRYIIQFLKLLFANKLGLQYYDYL